MSGGSEESLRVILRVRPQLGDVPATPELVNALSVDTDAGRISVSRNRKSSSEFSFYGIVDASEGQEKLYNYCSDIVNDAVSGVNCSVMAYGQTGKESALFAP